MWSRETSGLLLTLAELKYLALKALRGNVSCSIFLFGNITWHPLMAHFPHAHRRWAPSETLLKLEITVTLFHSRHTDRPIIHPAKPANFRYYSFYQSTLPQYLLWIPNCLKRHSSKIKAKPSQVIFGKEWKCRTAYWWIQQQYKPRAGQISKVCSGLLGPQDSGKPPWHTREAPAHKDTGFHANETSAGRFLLSSDFHPAPPLQSQRRTGGFWEAMSLWVAAKPRSCAKARRRKSLSWRRRSLGRRAVSPRRRRNTLTKCVRCQHGCKLHSPTGDEEC